jgi:hypothetical protein
MAKKLLRVFTWFFWNSVLLGNAYLWIFQGIQWAENLTRFLIWLIFLGTFLLAFSLKDKNKAKERGRSVPAYLNNATSLVLILGLAANANFLLAALMLLTVALEASVYDSFSEEQRP